MDISKYKLWTESDWAEQLTKEEENIGAYFEELNKYLDLPDEDYLVYTALKKRKFYPEELNARDEYTEYSFEEESSYYEPYAHNIRNQTPVANFHFDVGNISTDFCRDIAFLDIEISDEVLFLLFISGNK